MKKQGNAYQEQPLVMVFSVYPDNNLFLLLQ